MRGITREEKKVLSTAIPANAPEQAVIMQVGIALRLSDNYTIRPAELESRICGIYVKGAELLLGSALEASLADATYADDKERHYQADG
ncbi:MAG: hypothetical protein JNJ76_05580 [Candidatus Competibacter sp.]|nr:hypothetical protein [Candidatus Competibacter sp.]